MPPSHHGHLQLEGPHWAFALDLYRRPGVAQACLLLQDQAGADVTLVLFALFVADKHRAALGEGDLASLDHAVAAWRDEVIAPLRSLRRRMKAGPDPAPAPASEALRDRVKAAEIQAEQIELAVLAQWLERHPPDPGSSPVDMAAVLEQLAAFFAARCEAPRQAPRQARSPEVREALKTIADAMAGPGSGAAARPGFPQGRP